MPSKVFSLKLSSVRPLSFMEWSKRLALPPIFLWKMMIPISNIIALFISITIFLTLSCNNNKEDSPFGDLLSRSPYATLTDSIKKEPARDELYFRRAVLLNKNNFPEPALTDFQKAWSIRKEEKYA